MAEKHPQPVQPALKVPAAGNESAIGSNSETELVELIDLPRGRELSELNAMAMAKSRPIQLVVVAGPVDSGKTTLLTSLYELFQAGPVADHLFSGSDTLPAFEERCHLSRMASDNQEPKTSRTLYIPEPTYLHLKIASNGTPRIVRDFLFTDVSGEMFEHARDSTIDCKELTFLRRAGNFLLLLDSEKTLSTNERWAVVEDAKTLLQSCLDSTMLSSDCVVNVVWSKFDCIVELKNQKEHRKFRDGVAEEFLAAFGTRIIHLKFNEVAARPTKAPGLGFGNGVVELFKGWMTFCPRLREMNLSPETRGSRESELFARRHFSQ